MWETALAFAIWGTYLTERHAVAVPFYLWYRGVARCGVSRTSIGCFAEPLVATLFSLFILKDAPATPALLTGVAVALGAIAASARIRE